MRMNPAAAVLVALLAGAPSLASPADAPLPKFGFIAPIARHAVVQPMLDQFANDLLQRVAADASLAIVPLPHDNRVDVAMLDACHELGLAGFMAPHRETSVTDTLVTVEAKLNVSDCSGRLFYAGEVTRSAKRDDAAIPQTQLDAVQADATTELVRAFTVARTTHAAAWSLLTQTGSLEPVSPAPAPDATSTPP